MTLAKIFALPSPIQRHWQVGMRGYDQQVDDVVVEIGRYLHKHPDAADSVDGVRQWWLSTESSGASVAVVSAALDRLELEGVIRMRELPDGTRIYSGGSAGQRKNAN